MTRVRFGRFDDITRCTNDMLDVIKRAIFSIDYDKVRIDLHRDMHDVLTPSADMLKRVLSIKWWDKRR